MDRIFVENISFVGHHGVSRKERAIGHQMLVDLVVTCDTRRAGRSDKLAETIDHEVLARIAHQLGTANSFKLLETLADRIASAVLEATPALAVEVRVRKTSPTLPGLPAATGVTIARSRDGKQLAVTALLP
ncbi:MAG: dihydroneopterin aldolase [Deltaproteobacteria bacterium]|nr:dihydroneopterin aldolase [Deltaproteobacteria bacterium]